MLPFLLAVHFVLTIAIIGLILLQKHDSDGALGSSGGGAASGMFSVTGQANLLTRATAILMTVFICNCLVMAKLAKSTASRESIIDKVAREDRPLPAAQHSNNKAPDAAKKPTTEHNKASDASKKPTAEHKAPESVNGKPHEKH